MSFGIVLLQQKLKQVVLYLHSDLNIATKTV